MAWQYSTYIITDDLTVKRSLLLQHIKEIADAISSPSSISIGGNSWSKEQLQNYLKDLKTELKQLDMMLGLRRCVTIGRTRI